MRIILKILALGICWAIIRTVFLIWRFSRLGDLGALTNGIFGVTTILGWVLTLAIGPFAAIQLWRLRESGRRASLLLAMFALLYYIVPGLFFPQSGAKLSAALVPVAGNALFSAVLLSSPARRVCLGSMAEGISK